MSTYTLNRRWSGSTTPGSHQRLVDNDYLCNRNYQSTPSLTQVTNKSSSTFSLYSTYTPPEATTTIIALHTFSLQESPSHHHQSPNLDSPIHSDYIETQSSSSSTSFMSSYLCCGSCTQRFLCLQCIRTNELGILETFGQFQSILVPGFHCVPLWPWAQHVKRISLRIQQLDILCETKTQDAVFCKITITVLFRVMAEHCYEAHYRLLDPISLIQSSVMDILRTTVAKTLTLDTLFGMTHHLTNTIKNTIDPLLFHYGYQVMDVMITNIRPDDHVLMAWTDIHVAKRIRQSLIYKAEADKIQKLKAAEAHAEELYLSGVGVALQRKALAQGVKSSILTHSHTSNSLSNHSIREDMISLEDRDVMDVLLMTQYYDMLETISTSSSSTLRKEEQQQKQQQALFLPSSPSTVITLRNQLTNFAPCKIPDLLSSF